jgi:hypothetical protein
MRSLVALLAVLLAVPALAAPEPATSPGILNVIDILVRAGPVVMGIGAIIFPILVAFYRKDRDALERLIASVPSLYNVIEQERRRKILPVTADKLTRGVELAEERVAGRKLKPIEEQRVRLELQAQHEKVRAVGGPGGSPAAVSSTSSHDFFVDPVAQR